MVPSFDSFCWQLLQVRKVVSPKMVFTVVSVCSFSLFFFWNEVANLYSELVLIRDRVSRQINKKKLNLGWFFFFFFVKDRFTKASFVGYIQFSSCVDIHIVL